MSIEDDDRTDQLRDALRAGDPRGFAEAMAAEGPPPSLEGETFEGLRLVDFDLGAVDLSNTEWTNCDFERVRFGAANLQGAFFDHGRLTDCRFEGTDLGGASFDAVLLLRTEWDGVTTDGLEMENCQLDDCALRNTTLEDVAWSELSAARFTWEQVVGASGELTGLTMRDARFVEVDLAGISCSRCRASVQEGSSLPEGFSALGKRRGVV